MTRPRVEGIGRRVGRQVSGASGSTYTPTRDSRIMIEDSGFELLSKGLSGTIDSYTAVKTNENKEKRKNAGALKEEEQRQRAKATYVAKGNKSRVKTEYENFLNNNPEFQGLPPSEVFSQSEEARGIRDTFLNETSIPFPDILEQARFELGVDLDNDFSVENAKRIKAQETEDFRQVIRSDVAKVSAMPAEEAGQYLDGLITNSSGLFSLSPEEAGLAALDVQKELFTNAETGDGSLSLHFMNSEAIPSEIRKAHRDLYEGNAAVRKQAENLKRARIETTLIPKLIGESEDFLKQVYESPQALEQGIPKLYSWQDFKRLTKETKEKIDKEAQRQAAVDAGTEKYFSDDFNSWYDSETGYDHKSRKAVLAVEDRVTDILKTHPHYQQAEDKEEALLDMQLSLSKQHSRVPLKIQEELQASLKFPEDGFTDLPQSFLSSLDLAKKLVSKQMLVYAGLSEEQEMQLRSMLTITNTVGTTSEAINTVIMASKDKEKFMRTDFSAVKKLRDSLNGTFTGLLGDNPSAAFVMREATRLYNTIEASGLESAKALEVTEDAIKENYYNINGSVYNKRALAGFKEEEVEEMFSSFLDKFVEANPAQDREKVFVTEHGFGMYVVTDERGMPIENIQTGAPLWVGTGNLDEAIESLRQAKTESRNDSTRQSQQVNKDLRTFKESDEKIQAQSAALRFPSF